MELGFDYDSSFEGDTTKKKRKLSLEGDSTASGRAGVSYGYKKKSDKKYEYGMDEYRKYFSSFNAFDRHKILINQYLLYHPGSTSLLRRDTSRDKRDIDIIRENHRFIWEENTSIESWGKKIAKKYYDKLFKEYCICDLSLYKTGQVGMRWRTKQEVIDGKGQFTCAEKRCAITDNLRTWEMNFGYVEEGTKKNTLIKLRLCHDCSYKINYKHQRKEIKKMKMKKSKHHRNKKKSLSDVDEKHEEVKEGSEETTEEKEGERNVWKEPHKITEEKNREEEFEEYLEDLFL